MQVIRALRSAPLVSGSACLVLAYAGATDTVQIGHRFELTGSHLIIGRGTDADLQVDLDAVSRRHARLQLEGGRWSASDLNSTNGTYVNGAPVGEAPQPLQDGDELRVGVALLRFLCGADLVAEYIEELRRLGTTDGLTGAASRRALKAALDREAARAARHGRPLSLLRFDVSKLAAINESHGFLTGDHLIREVARRAGALLRPDDTLAHLGDGRFAALLPETGQEDAQRLSFKIGEAVAGAPFPLGEEQLHLALALGVASREAQESGLALLRAAEEQIAPPDRR
jgi:two-component system, cell cycle response regulator